MALLSKIFWYNLVTMHCIRKILGCLALLIIALQSTWGASGKVQFKESAYIVGPEDVITITVLNLPQFTSDYLVPPGGAIQVLGIGKLSVIGRSLDEISMEVSKRFSGRLAQPEITVTLKVPRIRRIYVLGDVKTPGTFDVKQGWNVAEALSAAGGLIPLLQPQDVTIYLERPSTGDHLELPLEKALTFGGRPKWDFNVGDVLRIQSLEMIPVYVAGEVKVPGMVLLRGDTSDALAAIALAGGTNQDAALGAVKLIRLSGDQVTLDLTAPIVHGDKIAKTLLRRGDMLLVPQLADRYAVLGYVPRAGYFPIPAGVSLRLADALASVGGAETLPGGGAVGRFSRVGLVRTQNGKSASKVYDLTQFFLKGDIAMNPEIKPGDVIYVPQSPKVPLGTVLQAMSAIGSLLQGLSGGHAFIN